MITARGVGLRAGPKIKNKKYFFNILRFFVIENSQFYSTTKTFFLWPMCNQIQYMPKISDIDLLVTTNQEKKMQHGKTPIKWYYCFLVYVINHFDFNINKHNKQCIICISHYG